MPLSFTLQIPASTANLGAGFDCLGLALNLYNLLRVEPAPGLRVSIEGEGGDTLARSVNNRVVRAMQLGCAVMGKPLPPVSLQMTNRIPLARGLGSSAAAAVGGLLAANVYYDEPLSRDDLLALATQIEGHPDNVAPALLGGFCVATMAEGKPVVLRLDFPPALRLVVFVPAAPLRTRQARGVLPAKVPRADAVFNLGRAALWVAALGERRFDLLSIATQDRLHQPYRFSLIPGSEQIIAAAIRAGAHGAFISGAGSSIAALADQSCAPIAAAMQDAAQTNGQHGHVLELQSDPTGARLQDEPGNRPL